MQTTKESKYKYNNKTVLQNGNYYYAWYFHVKLLFYKANSSMQYTYIVYTQEEVNYMIFTVVSNIAVLYARKICLNSRNKVALFPASVIA